MGQRTQNCKAPLFQAHMCRPHAYGTAMHDDFGSLAVPYSTAAAVLLSFNTYHVSAAWGVHGRDRLPGHRLAPFPGFHVARSNRKDRVNCLVDREEYLDRTWILCSLADENKRFVVLSMRLIIFQK